MIERRTPKLKNGEKILFFGRSGCNYSEKCVILLLNLGYEVSIVWSKRKGERLPDNLGDESYDYILSFRSYFILPVDILNNPNFYCVNFHPGPPSYPGIGCINFSLYNNEPNFGITVHLMEKTIDTGKIIDYEYFPVSEDQDLLPILKLTHQKLFDHFVKFANGIVSEGNSYVVKKLTENANVKWSGEYKNYKDFEKYLTVQKDISEEDLKRRIKAFHHPNFPLHVILNGKKFYLKLDEQIKKPNS